MAALEKPERSRGVNGEFVSEHPGSCGAQDALYVGNVKGVGRSYQQTFVDIYSKVAAVKLYDRKSALKAADFVNDQIFLLYQVYKSRLPLTVVLQVSGRFQLPRHRYRWHFSPWRRLHLVLVMFRLATKLRAAVGEDPKQPDVMLLIQRKNSVIEEISSGQCRPAVVRLHGGYFAVGVDKGLLVDSANSLRIADIERILRTAVARIFANKLTMRFLAAL